MSLRRSSRKVVLTAAFVANGTVKTNVVGNRSGGGSGIGSSGSAGG